MARTAEVTGGSAGINLGIGADVAGMGELAGFGPSRLLEPSTDRGARTMAEGR